MWVNMDGDREMVRKLTGMLVCTRQVDDAPLTIQMQPLKRIGDEAQLYHVSSRHTEVIAMGNADIILKHSSKALGKLNPEYEHNLASGVLLMIDEEGTTEHTFRWTSGAGANVCLFRWEFAKTSGEQQYIPMSVSESVINRKDYSSLRVELPVLPSDLDMSWACFCDMTSKTDVLLDGIAVDGVGVEGTPLLQEDERSIDAFLVVRSFDDAGANPRVRARLVLRFTSTQRCGKMGFKVLASESGDFYADNARIPKEVGDVLTPYLGFLVLENFSIVRDSSGKYPTPLEDEVHLAHRFVDCMYDAARRTGQTLLSQKILWHGIRLISDVKVQGNCLPSEVCTFLTKPVNDLAETMEAAGDFASAAAMYELLFLSMLEMDGSVNCTASRLARTLANNAAVAFARTGTAEAYALAEVYHMYGGLRNDYNMIAWTSLSRLYVRMGLLKEFAAVMRMCTHTTFRTKRRVTLVRQAAESGCVGMLRAAVRSIADDLPKDLNVDASVARIRISTEGDMQNAKEELEVSLWRMRLGQKMRKSTTAVSGGEDSEYNAHVQRYNAREQAEAAAKRAEELERRAKIARSRAERAAKPERPMSAPGTSHKAPRGKEHKRPIKQGEETIHVAYLNRDRSVLSAAFDARQEAAHLEAMARKERADADRIKHLISEAEKDAEAKAHVVPSTPTLDFHLP